MLEDMRHDHGSVLPTDTLAKLSAKEVDYFKQYDSLLTEYMTSIDLDITAVGTQLRRRDRFVCAC